MHARLAALALAAAVASAKLVTIDNTKPRLDDQGNILDGHDGRIQKFNGTYYMHTLAYGLCHEPDQYGCDMTADRCGFHLDHNISVYTSPDLSSGSWHYVGNAIDVAARPAGTVFRPDAVYNPHTGLWVLWFNWVAANGTYMGFATSTSPVPEGPFTLVEDTVTLSHSNSTYHAGDWHFFIDDDANKTGYVIYCAEFYCWIEQLTPDYLHSTGNWFGPLGDTLYFVEAPAMFKRNGVYYASVGHCCCFCFQGSGVKIYTATSPLGPWTHQPGLDDLACVNPSQVDGPAEGQVEGNMGAQALWHKAPEDDAAAAAADGTITVVEASFGSNCNGNLTGGMTAAVGAWCNGQVDCTYQVCICGGNVCEQGAPPCVADPDLGCAKTFNVTWTCSNAPGVNMTMGVPAEADNAVVPLTCSGAQRPWVMPTPGQGCLYQATQVSTTRSQQSSIAQVDTPTGPVWLYIGDRWMQAPDGIKGHEPQFVVPLQFDANGNVLPITWVDNFTIDVI